ERKALIELFCTRTAGRVGLQADGVHPAAAVQVGDRVVPDHEARVGGAAVSVVDRDAIGAAGDARDVRDRVEACSSSRSRRSAPAWTTIIETLWEHHRGYARPRPVTRPRSIPPTCGISLVYVTRACPRFPA